MPKRRLEFMPNFVRVEAAKLKKFSAADGKQSQWLMAQTEPIFESRAV
jgi:hypothetical protein